MRRRLKRHGWGVRKVESVGRNQDIVIHTATGAHLRELRAMFQDVIAPPEERPGAEPAAKVEQQADEPIASLRNIGPTTAAWLCDTGIRTRADLERIGCVVAYRLVKQRQPAASLNLLWALAAGRQDMDWRELPEDTRQPLLQELEDR